MQTFHFMDGIQPDAQAKKLMRRHIMKGKNAGKRISRPSRLALQEARKSKLMFQDTSNPIRTAETLSYHQRLRDSGWVYLSPNSAARAFGNVLLPFSLRADISPESLTVINSFFACVADRMYPAHLGLSLHEAKLMWMHMLAADTESYQCSLLLMSSCIEYFGDRVGNTAKAMEGLSRAFTIVNKRVQGGKALENSTMGLVMSLVNHEQLRRDPQTTKIHLRGLIKMIELRGGLDEIAKSADPFLIFKLCKTDLVCALQYGGTPYLYRDDISRARKALEGKNMRFECTLPVPKSVDSTVLSVWQDVMAFCNLYNNHLGQNRTLSCLTYYDVMTSILYRLIRLAPLSEEDGYGLSKKQVHPAGLLTFIMSIYMPHSSRRIIKYHLISRHMRSAIEVMTKDDCLDKLDEQMLFWLRMVGCIWSGGDENEEWFMTKTREMAEELGIRSWPEASLVLNRFPWLKNFHEEVGMETWKRLQQIQSPV